MAPIAEEADSDDGEGEVDGEGGEASGKGGGAASEDLEVDLYPQCWLPFNPLVGEWLLFVTGYYHTLRSCMMEPDSWYAPMMLAG